MFQRFKDIYREKTLHQKVRLSILVFSVFPLIFLACISLLFIYRNQVSKIQKVAYEDIQDRFNNMTYEMNTIELMAKTVWSDTTFITEVGKAVIEGSLGEYNRYLFKEQTLSTLRVITSISQVQSARIHLDYPGLREYPFYLYSMNRAKNSLWYEDRNSLIYNGAWYLEVTDITDRQPYGTYYTYFVGDDMASYVMPIKISSDLTGVFEIVLPMKAIVPNLYKNIEKSDIFLVDSKERLLGVEEDSDFANITIEDLADIMGISSIQEYKEQGVQLYYGRWQKNPVILSVVRNKNTGILLMQLIHMGQQNLVILLEIVGVFLIGILMAVFLLKAINKIVEHLLRDFNVFAACMKEVGEGNLDLEIPKLEQVEINVVAMEHNRMLARVKQLMEDSIHREVMVKEAQLKSLEKQIDSHFLYNVLDSIKMMAEVRGIYNISDVVIALSRMFRYNLQVNCHSVTLWEEISYLESYIKLCNIRYDYYIHLSENASDFVRELKVPKVILQPIAENSISHGLDELAKDTTIYLKAYVEGESFYIEMTDMGKGMDEITLNKVREGILDGTKGNSLGKGIGLHNIHERIRLMNGEQYGVTIHSKEGCYTKVVLKLRLEERT